MLNKEKDLALLEFEVKGKKRTVEKILEATNKSSEADRYVTAVNYAKSEFSASTETDITTLNDIHSIGFIPYDFMESEKGWTTVKLNKTELEQLYKNASEKAAGLPPQVITIDYQDSSIEGIELDYQFVH